MVVITEREQDEEKTGNASKGYKLLSYKIN